MVPGVQYQSFLCSKPFLVVGPQQTLFYAHSNLLAKCSPVLARDVKGEMQERHLETIEIKDVEGDIDDDTVMRFIEYAYRDDYKVPDPDVLQLSTDSKELETAFIDQPSVKELGDLDWNSWGPSAGNKKKKDKKKRKSLSRHDARFDIPASPAMSSTEPLPQVEPITTTEQEPRESRPCSFAVDAARDEQWIDFCSQAQTRHILAWEPSANNDEREDFTIVFLCHARLYKFADRYRCDSLMDLTLQRLRLTLSRYIFHPERASAVVELIRYTYAHTFEPGKGQDGLRALVLDYATSYVRELMQEPSFVDLIKEGGSLAGDIMARVARMVS